MFNSAKRIGLVPLTGSLSSSSSHECVSSAWREYSQYSSTQTPPTDKQGILSYFSSNETHDETSNE